MVSFAMDSKQSNQGTKKGKKSNYVSIYNKEGNAIQLPGRHACQCEASVHNLISNCLNCGRIVCEQEGSGPCFTCGNLVCSKDERALIDSNTMEGMEVLSSLTGEELGSVIANKTIEIANEKKASEKKAGGFKDIAASLDSAIHHKNKLIDYDRNSEKRTKVIDDEMDYFKIGSEHWLSEDKRQELKAKAADLHEKKNQKQRKLLLNFNEKQITAYDEPAIANVQEVVEQLMEETKTDSDYQIIDAKMIDSLALASLPRPKYYPSTDKTKRAKKIIQVSGQSTSDTTFTMLKVQDSNLMEITDDGICLTIQQPYASLLISGIKETEGRVWYTPYRGRLWIHASAKEPKKDEIESIENFYRFKKSIENFPTTYPTGCLIGCITVLDVLPLEEYLHQNPDSDSDDPYIIVFEEPKSLPAPIPMKGKLKLFKLDTKIHGIAVNQLRVG